MNRDNNRSRPPRQARENNRILETLILQGKIDEARSEALRMKTEREARQAEWNARNPK